MLLFHAQIVGMDLLSWDSPPPEEFSAAFAGKQGAGKQGKQGKRGLDSPLPVVQWAKKEFSVRPGAGKQGAGKPGKQGKRGLARVITHTWFRKLVAKWCDRFPNHADRPQLGTWLDWSVNHVFDNIVNKQGGPLRTWSGTARTSRLSSMGG